MTAAATASLAAGMRIMSLDRAERRLRRVMNRDMRAAVQFAARRDLPGHGVREALAAARLERPDLFEPIEGSAFEVYAKQQIRDTERKDLVKGHRNRLLREWRAALTAGGWPKPDGPPPPIVFRVTAGAGKTHAAMAAVLDVMATLPDGVPLHVAFLAPDHGLVERHAATAREMTRERGMDVSVVTLAGRGHKRPDGTHICKRAALAKEVASKGLSVRRLVCGPASQGAAACPDCDYWKQGGDMSDRTLVFATHSGKRGDELPCGVRCPALVIVDESPLPAMKVGEPLEVELDTLRNWRVWPDDEEFGEHRDEVGTVARNVCDLALDVDAGKVAPNAWREFMAGRGISPEKLRAAVEKADAMIDHLRREADRDARAHRKDAQLLAALKAPNGSPMRHKMARDVRDVLAAVLADWEAGLPILQSVTFAPEKKDGSITLAFVHLARPLVEIAGGRMTERRAVIALDATAHPLLIPFTWGRDARMVRIDVERRETAVLVPDAPTSHTRLGVYDNENTPPSERQAHADNREAILATLRDFAAAHGDGNLSATLPKAARGGAEAVPGIGPVFHHGATRGRNDAAKCSGKVVIGRNQPHAVSVENMARALVHGHGMELHLPGEYAAAASPIPMRDGALRDGPRNAPNHAEPIVQALLEATRECEVEQAADRTRSVRADPKAQKHIALLGPISGNRPIDAVVPWRLQRVLAAAAADPAFQAGRPAPLTHGAWLEAKVPDLLRGNAQRSASARRQAIDHLANGVAGDFAALVVREGERWSRALSISSRSGDHRSAFCAVTLKGRKGVKWLIAGDAEAFSDAAIRAALDGAEVAEKLVMTEDDARREAVEAVTAQFESDLVQALVQLPNSLWQGVPDRSSFFNQFLPAWRRVAHTVLGTRDADAFTREIERLAAADKWAADVADAKAAGIALLAYSALSHCSPLLFPDVAIALGMTEDDVRAAATITWQALALLVAELNATERNKDEAMSILHARALEAAGVAAYALGPWVRAVHASDRGGAQRAVVAS
jgi:hypothetical protein